MYCPMYCPICGRETESYSFNVAFEAYNFSCKFCKKRYFLFTKEVNNG